MYLFSLYILFLYECVCLFVNCVLDVCFMSVICVFVFDLFYNSLGHGLEDDGVSVGGVTDDKDTDVGVSVLCDSLTLALEDSAVLSSEVASLHTSLTGESADHDDDISADKASLRVSRADDVAEERIRAVLKLHSDALKSCGHEGNVDELQDDRLVRAEEVPAGNQEGQRVGDLPGGTGDGDAEGLAGVGLGGVDVDAGPDALAGVDGDAVGVELAGKLAYSGSRHLCRVKTVDQI